MKLTDEHVEACLEALGITEREPGTHEYDQLAVLLEAFLLSVERNAHWKDCWKESGWRGCLFDVHKKADRIWVSLWRDGDDEEPEHGLDSALDLINFCGFLIRGRRQGIQGDWKW